LNIGQKGLDHTRNVLEANPDLTPRRVLLLYDCDLNKPPKGVGPLRVRSVPRKDQNGTARKGIENLLPPALFERRFYLPKVMSGDYGENKTVETFDKAGCCRWVCEERRQATDFECFFSVVEIVEEFLSVRGLGLSTPWRRTGSRTSASI
jgi:hypothetical protein